MLLESGVFYPFLSYKPRRAGLQFQRPGAVFESRDHSRNNDSFRRPTKVTRGAMQFAGNQCDVRPADVRRKMVRRTGSLSEDNTDLGPEAGRPNTSRLAAEGGL